MKVEWREKERERECTYLTVCTWKSVTIKLFIEKKKYLSKKKKSCNYFRFFLQWLELSKKKNPLRVCECHESFNKVFLIALNIFFLSLHIVLRIAWGSWWHAPPFPSYCACWNELSIFIFALFSATWLATLRSVLDICGNAARRLLPRAVPADQAAPWWALVFIVHYLLYWGFVGLGTRAGESL